jgi:hypothetical protein
MEKMIFVGMLCENTPHHINNQKHIPISNVMIAVKQNV